MVIAPAGGGLAHIDVKEPPLVIYAEAAELRNPGGRGIHLTGCHAGRLDIGRLTQKMP